MNWFLQRLHNLKKLVVFVSFLLPVIVLAQQQITPEFLVEIEPNRYVVHFRLPNYWFEEDDSYDYVEEVNYGESDDCGTFVSIEMDADYDVTDIATYPELPFFSLNLLLPSNASNVRATLIDSQFQNENLHYPVVPALNGTYVDFVNNQYRYRQNDSDPCLFYSEYYRNGYDSIYPHGFYQDYYSLSGISHYLSSNGCSFSVFPFSYQPENNFIRVLTKATFIIEFSGDDVTQVMSDYMNSHEYVAFAIVSMYDNFNNNQFDESRYDAPKYLIVASHHDMDHTLQPYVNYKRSQNFNTEVVYLDDLGIQDSLGIAQIIRNNDRLSKPDYVLLVGSLGDIPPAIGTSNPEYPYTDDAYHHCIGRWIVTGADGHYSSLERIIDKTISTEHGYADNHFTCSAILLSGIDSTSRRLSKAFYKQTKKIDDVSFARTGIPSTLYDGRRPNVTFNSVAQALRANPSFVIYCGHGTRWYNGTTYVGSAISHPYCICPTIFTTYNHNDTVWNPISALNNQSPFPMGFGFSCVLNTYHLNNSFATNWLWEPNGGVSFYGSTTTSYSRANKYLSKKLFSTFRRLRDNLNNFPIGLWLRTGEHKYYSALQNTDRRNQVYRYNLMGDPTLHVFGLSDHSSSSQYRIAPKDLRNINEEEIKAVTIYDIFGREVASGESLEILDYELEGVKIVVITFTNGLSQTYKLL